jgi:hypothetical protein
MKQRLPSAASPATIKQVQPVPGNRLRRLGGGPPPCRAAKVEDTVGPICAPSVYHAARMALRILCSPSSQEGNRSHPVQLQQLLVGGSTSLKPSGDDEHFGFGEFS